MADIAVTRFAATTYAFGGTQDVTISGFGTPSAVLLFYTAGVTDGTVAAHSRWSVCAIDGTTQYSTISRGRDGNASSGVARGASAARSVYSIADSGTSLNGALTGSLITDGLRLTVATQMPAAYLVTAVFFSSNVQAKLIIKGLGTSTSAQDINTVGFEPDVVFAFGFGDTASGGTTAFNTPTFGIAVNDGSATQRGLLSRNRAAVDPTQIATAVLTGKVGGSLSTTGDTVFYNLTISDFDADGFSITQSASSSGDEIALLSIKLPTGDQFKLFDTSVPTSGSIAATSPGFTPYFGLMGLLAGPTAVDTVDASNGGVMAVAAFDADAIYTVSASSADNAADTVEKSLADDSFTLLRASDGTAETTSSGYAFDSQGWDITLTANPAAAVLGFGLAIGDASAAGAGIRNPLGGPLTLRKPLGR